MPLFPQTGDRRGVMTADQLMAYSVTNVWRIRFHIRGGR